MFDILNKQYTDHITDDTTNSKNMARKLRSINGSSETHATQLSYSLMRILSNEHCAETVKSFLLRTYNTITRSSAKYFLLHII